jgi:hypothetical protein
MLSTARNIIAGDLTPHLPAVVSRTRSRILATGIAIDLGMMTGEIFGTFPMNTHASYETPVMLGTAFGMGAALISKAKESAKKKLPRLQLAKFGAASMTGCVAAAQFAHAAFIVTVNTAEAGFHILPDLLLAQPVLTPIIMGGIGLGITHALLRSAYGHIGWKPPTRPNNRRPPSGPKGPPGV